MRSTGSPRCSLCGVSLPRLSWRPSVRSSKPDSGLLAPSQNGTLRVCTTVCYSVGNRERPVLGRRLGAARPAFDPKASAANLEAIGGSTFKAVGHATHRETLVPRERSLIERRHGPPRDRSPMTASVPANSHSRPTAEVRFRSLVAAKLTFNACGKAYAPGVALGRWKVETRIRQPETTRTRL